jgi:hypothetical protein
MEPYEFWTLFGMFVTIFLTMIGGFIWLIVRTDNKSDELKNKFEVLGSKVEGIGNRLNRLEEKISGMENRLNHLEGMLQTIVGFLLGNKTGTNT